MSGNDPMTEAFVAGAGWTGAARSRLAGDASGRIYWRLTRDTGERAILMDARGEAREATVRFVEIARHLGKAGLSAPEILAGTGDEGLLMIEDLGDGLFAPLIAGRPDLELPLYRAAVDVLIHLRGAPGISLDLLGPTELAELIAIAFTDYAGGIAGHADDAASARILSRFEDILHRTTRGHRGLVHRDYHAENLIWLPGRDGVRRVGLLDFQDAKIGHPAYDLVSLLQDVRRDVSAATEMAMIDHYIAATDSDEHGFRTAYAVLGVQRNLRILGVFARLVRHANGPKYAALIPRVWAHVMRDLEHPALAAVAQDLMESLPPPTPQNLARLESR